ncbi:hypothetical protein IJJ27_03960 [bacterium]|nr:hypothetical protein [bacterium]MBQ6436682.1 hypothetical protein [bacterium]
MSNKLNSRKIIILIIGLLVIIALLIIFVLNRRQPRKFTSDLASTNSDFAQTGVAALNSDFESNFYIGDKNLDMAGAILQQFENSLNSQGKGGNTYTCSKDSHGYRCNQADENDKWLYRNALGMIWGRYQYYKKTGDQVELEHLKRDLTNMYESVDGMKAGGFDTFHTNRYNCLLMADLATDQSLGEFYQNLARQICLRANFEYYPYGALAYDQHFHLQLSLNPRADLTQFNEWPVIVDANKAHLASQAAQNGQDDSANLTASLMPEIIYHSQHFAIDKQDVLDDLTAELTELASSGQITGHNYPDYDYAVSFLLRELFASLDRLGVMKITEPDSPEYQAAELDYLLLTKEALEIWVTSQQQSQQAPINYNDHRRCLMQENLFYLFNHYLTDFDRQAQQSVLDYFALSDQDYLAPHCAVAALKVNNKTINLDQVRNSVYTVNQKYINDNRVPVGSILKINDDQSLEYFVHDNGLFVGILSQ